MTDVYDVYNAVIDIMCAHCNPTLRKKCNHLPDEIRYKTKIYCMKQILRRDNEEYPTELPEVMK